MSTTRSGATTRTGRVLRKRRRASLLGLLGVVLSFVLVAAACGGSDGDAASTTTAPREAGADPLEPRPLAERRTVRFGTPFAGIESFSQLHMAAFLGELEKENLDFELKTVPFPEGVLLLERGDIDVYPYSLSPILFNAIAGGSNVRLITSTAAFPEESKSGYWVHPDFVEQFENCEFEGVAWSAGGSAGLSGVGALPIAEYLRDECDGMTFEDIDAPSLVGGADLLVALESGAVKFGFFTEPFWVDVEEQGLGEFMLPFPQGVHTAGYAMSEERNDDPEFTDAILRALLRTTQNYLQGDYHEDPEVKKFLIDELELSEATLQKIPALDFDPELNFTDEAVKPLQEIWLESGDFLTYDEPLTFDEIFDTKPLQRVLG